MDKISGLELAYQIASGKISREDVISSSFDRINKLDHQIRAFVSLLDCDHAVALASKARGPLAGMPVAVKDIYDTADLPTAYGSPIYSNFRPATDAAIVSLIKRAGGTVLGKTVTSEFAYMAPTLTRNPADIRRTAGGSSSGSAAAVASGMVPFAIGTQTGGSTIRPASFCGIAGYKPTFGMFPSSGMKCFSLSLDTVGLFAANVTDVGWFAETLIGRPLKPTPSDIRDLVIGVPLSYPWKAPSVSATLAVERACSAIEACGGKVRQIAFPAWLGELYEAHEVLQQYEANQSLAFEFDRYRDSLSPMLASFLLSARRVSAVEYDAIRKLISESKQKIDELFGDIHALITPSAQDEAPMGLSSTGEPTFNKVWTLLGTPCVSVPGLTGVAGCPMGIQVITAPWRDQQCLIAAELVESAVNSYIV